MINSPTIASQTPAQTSQSHNVRKCPVLSGPTDLSGEIDASTDTQTTCAQNPSYPDQTWTRHPPCSSSRKAVAPRPAGSALPPHFCILHSTFCIFCANVRKCPVLSGPTDLPREIDASIDNQTTCAQNLSSPDRTSPRQAPTTHFSSWCVRSPSACLGMLSRYAGRACLWKASPYSARACLGKRLASESRITASFSTPIVGQFQAVPNRDFSLDFCDNLFL